MKIMHIPRNKYALLTCCHLIPVFLIPFNISLLVQLNLAFKNFSRGNVADCHKSALSRKLGGFPIFIFHNNLLKLVAANHHHPFLLKKWRITRGTRAYPPPAELFFTGNSEPVSAGAGSDNHSIGGVLPGISL